MPWGIQNRLRRVWMRSAQSQKLTSFGLFGKACGSLKISAEIFRALT